MKREFNPAWKNEAQFKSWLAEDETSIYSFKCRKCHATLDLGHVGKNRLKQHMKSQKHKSVSKHKGVSKHFQRCYEKSRSAGLLKSVAKSSKPTANSSSNVVQSVVSDNLVSDYVLVCFYT